MFFIDFELRKSVDICLLLAEAQRHEELTEPIKFFLHSHLSSFAVKAFVFSTKQWERESCSLVPGIEFLKQGIEIEKQSSRIFN